MEDTLLQITKSEFWTIVGGAGVVITALSAFISSLIAERLKSRWQKKASIDLEAIKKQSNLEIESVKKSANLELENFRKSANLELEFIRKVSTKEIEDLRGEIARSNAVITTHLAQQGQAYQKVLEKKIAATQTAWDAVLGIKALVPPIVSLTYSIVREKELEEGMLDKIGKGLLKLDPSFGEQIGSIDLMNLMVKFEPFTNEFKKLRPFLSPKLSLLLFIYNAVTGRTIVNLVESYRQNRVTGWRRDDGIQQLLKSVLDEAEANYIFNVSREFQHFASAIDLLETKILNEMNIVLSGEKLTDDTIAQVEKLDKVFKASQA